MSEEIHKVVKPQIFRRFDNSVMPVLGIELPAITFWETLGKLQCNYSKRPDINRKGIRRAWQNFRRRVEKDAHLAFQQRVLIRNIFSKTKIRKFDDYKRISRKD